MEKKNSVGAMFWKIYFWIFLLLAFATYSKTLQVKDLWAWARISDFIISVPSLLGFYLYSYKRVFFPTKFWKIYCVLFLIIDFCQNTILVPAFVEHNYNFLNMLFGFLIVAPCYFANYLYAFKFRAEI